MVVAWLRSVAFIWIRRLGGRFKASTWEYDPHHLNNAGCGETLSVKFVS